jgi:hypothetical protein
VLNTQLSVSPYALSAQLVFAPNIEVNRPIFFLVANQDWFTDPPVIQGSLYRSGDGGLTWQETPLPGNLAPTALAVSPGFAQDGLLLLGMVDGQVFTWPP